MNVAELPLFRSIDRKLLSRLTEGGALETYTKKNLAFEEGERADWFGIVICGMFRLTKCDPRGDRVSILFLAAGGLAGDLVMAEEEPCYVMTCEALNSGHIFWIPRETYLRTWLSSAVIMGRVQIATLARINWMTQSRADQRLALERRLAGFLLRSNATVTANAGLSELPLTRRDLADAVGASVESVIRVMTKLEKRGLISTASRTIRILQPGTLKALYDDGPAGPS